MCVVHGKRIVEWFRNQETHILIEALAKDLGLEVKSGNSHLSNTARLSASKYARLFPDLIISKGGPPENGGGVWLHPDLAIQLAQWCNPFFAIQVSRWVREWLTILEQNRRAEDKMQQPQSEHEKASNVFSEESAFFLLESTEPFPVDLDDAIEWWDCRTKAGKPLRRDNLVRKLRANYYEGVNYHLLKNEEVVNRPQGGGTTADKYFLTIECFKMMGMQVSGERGNEIRRYFLNCEADLKRRLKEDEKQKHWKVIKACVLPGSVAISTSSVKSYDALLDFIITVVLS